MIHCDIEDHLRICIQQCVYEMECILFGIFSCCLHKPFLEFDVDLTTDLMNEKLKKNVTKENSYCYLKINFKIIELKIFDQRF